MIIKGLRLGLVLLSGIMLYATALKAAGMVVCLPPERTVCAIKEGNLQFPLSLNDTSLKILRTICYEGPYLENGSNEPVVNALALLVENTGQSHIRTAWVMLTTAEETYFFLAQDLPPGSRTILLESHGQLWTREPFCFATGGAETAEEDLLSKGQLEIREVDMGSVVVTNRTEETIRDLELTYKNYLSDARVYQGGIAYRCTIDILNPGQSVTLYPSRYAAGYSRFVYACSTGEP